MKRVLNAIANFFKNIVKWVKETAWIQPLLIVGCVFGLIASIKPISNAIGEWTKPTSSSNFYKRNLVSYDELVTKVNSNGENDVLIVIFIKEKNETCEQCNNQQSQFEKFFSANHEKAEDGRKYNVAVLDIASDEFTEDKVEDNELKDIAELIELWNLDTTWIDMPSEYNAPSGGEISEKIDKDDEYNPLPTPTIARFDGKECVGVAMGYDSTNNKFLRFCYSRETVEFDQSKAFKVVPGEN